MLVLVRLLARLRSPILTLCDFAILINVSPFLTTYVRASNGVVVATAGVVGDAGVILAGAVASGVCAAGSAAAVAAGVSSPGKVSLAVETGAFAREQPSKTKMPPMTSTCSATTINTTLDTFI